MLVSQNAGPGVGPPPSNLTKEDKIKMLKKHLNLHTGGRIEIDEATGLVTVIGGSYGQAVTLQKALRMSRYILRVILKRNGLQSKKITDAVKQFKTIYNPRYDDSRPLPNESIMKQYI